VSTSGRDPRGVWLKLLFASAFGVALLEGGMRFLLTSPWTERTELARSIGEPSRFAWPNQDLYWRFVDRLATPEAATFEPPYDPVLGWTWPGIQPVNYAHEEESQLQGRRPVLLFGDSYSACLTSSEQCFEGFMRHSLLSKRNLLLNYGVCGYGFDQTWLLTRATVDRFAGQDPAVVVGLLVDDDLNRTLLSLREYPKPRLRVEDGRVVVPQQRVPSYAEWRDDPLPLPKSWAWTWVRHAFSRDPLEDPQSAQRRELVELTRASLRELVDDLRAREVDFFFLLFHTEHAFQLPVPADWRTQLVCDTLDDLGAPWYDVREELARRLAEDGGAIGDFYIPRDQPGGGHYDVDGNEAAFAVLRRGLAEVCDVRTQPGDVPEAWAFLPRYGEGGGLASYSAGPAAPFDRVPSEARLVLRAPRDTPSSMRYPLEGLALRFRAAVWAYEPQQAPGEFELTVLVDGLQSRVLRVVAGAAPQELEVDLAGVAELELRLAPHAARGCVVLADPLLEPAR
jgi:hypothetical protein